MDRERVALVRCDDYRREGVREGVARAFDLLGGASVLAKPGESVFIKVNAVMAAGPETAKVTNPEVVRAVAEQFLRITDRVSIGDSPGGPFNPTLLKRVYEKTGLAAVTRETGAELAMDTRTVEVPFPEGRALKRLTLCRSMVEADRLVSVSKFKSHRYMNVTGPIKNLYGAVPGMNKFVYHSRFDDGRRFADLIIDVHLAARPAFHVVDSVEAIDGDGSRRGSIKKLGAIAAGRNAFALESLMMELAGLDAAASLPLAAAIERGACLEGAGWFTVLGDSLEGLKVDDFRLPSANLFSERVPALVTERFSRLVSVTPRPLPGKCTLCGTCAKVCPRGAITLDDRVARVDLKRCIRCFCCDELCEHEAIAMRQPLLARVIRRSGA
jgi:uncharacterized protein (DUF362 family)/Pyruvate/2-oxoacid:ferredoxin oxidoreductase delta subunit